jgi:hypothetical protein
VPQSHAGHPSIVFHEWMDLTEIGNLTAASEKVSEKMERGVLTGLDEQSCFFNTAPEHELVE